MNFGDNPRQPLYEIEIATFHIKQRTGGEFIGVYRIGEAEPYWDPNIWAMSTQFNAMVGIFLLKKKKKKVEKVRSKKKKNKAYRINITSITDTFRNVDRFSKFFEWRVHAGQDF